MVSEREKTALARLREANRAAAVQDVQDLARHVADAERRGQIEGRSRLGGMPLVAGGRTWLMVVMLRDHPLVFSDCLAGEFGSVAEAARAAGLSRGLPRRRIELGKNAAKSARAIHAALDADELGPFLSELIKRDPKRAARAIFTGLDEKQWRTFAGELVTLENERERRRRPARSPWAGKGKRRRPLSGSRVV